MSNQASWYPTQISGNEPQLFFSKNKIELNCSHFSNLCNSIFGVKNWESYYPVKVGNDPKILNIISQAGIGFEVINSNEANQVFELGKSPVILSGNTKSEDLVKTFSPHLGWRFVVCESKREVELVNHVAQSLGVIQLILLRVKLTPNRRLGMPVDDLLDIFSRSKEYSHCHIAGIHAHPGSNISYEIAMKTTNVIENTVNTIYRNRFCIEYINFGSGLPVIDTHLEDFTKRLEEFNRIAQKFNIKVIIEPGRPLIADAACLITTITEVRPREHQISINSAAYVLHGPCRADSFVYFRRIGSDILVRLDVMQPKVGSHRICGIWPAEGDSLWVNGLPNNCAEGDEIIFPHAGAYSLGFLSEISFDVLEPRFLGGEGKFND